MRKGASRGASAAYKMVLSRNKSSNTLASYQAISLALHTPDLGHMQSKESIINKVSNTFQHQSLVRVRPTSDLTCMKHSRLKSEMPCSA